MRTASLVGPSLLVLCAGLASACAVKSVENNQTVGAAGTSSGKAGASAGGSASGGRAGATGGSAGATAGSSGASGAGNGGASAGKGGASAGSGGASGATAGGGGTTAGSGGATAGSGGATAGSGGATAGSGGAIAAGSGGSAGAAAGAGGSSGGAGGSPTAAKPFFCPEATPFSPKNANSVDVQGTGLAKDETWTADKVYLVFKDYSMDGHTLTIEPGTVVCLIQQGRIHADGGTLLVKGTAEKHVTFTAAESQQEPGRPDQFHRGVEIDSYQNSVFSYLDIWYGGKGGGSGAPVLDIPANAHATDAKKPLKLDHVTIGEIQTQGLSIRSRLGLDPTSSVTVTGYAAQGKGDPVVTQVLTIDLEAAKSVHGVLSIDLPKVPPAARHVSLFSVPQISVSVSLPDYGMPYELSGVKYIVQAPDLTPTLTLEAGVTLKTDAQLVIGSQTSENDGNLVLAGTAEKPVTITSLAEVPAAGDWPGIVFEDKNFDPAVTRFTYAKILYAGVPADLSAPSNVGRCGGNFTGAIQLPGSFSFVGPTFKNTLIAHSKSDGIVAAASNNGNTKLTSDYAAETTLTFEDIAGVNLRTGPCPLRAAGCTRSCALPCTQAGSPRPARTRSTARCSRAA